MKSTLQSRERPLTFGSYTLDLTNQQLWRDGQPVPLTPKAWQVLAYFLTHQRQLVTRATLFRVVWPDVVVTDAALDVIIHEIRRALGDERQSPRYIETVHRRGYRFIAPFSNNADSVREPQVQEQGPLQLARDTPRQELDVKHQALSPPLVEREADLSHLHRLLKNALDGTRQLVFVTGEPGIGKTALVDAFTASVREPASADGAANSSPTHAQLSSPSLPLRVWVGMGQCIEHHGAGEAFLPILDALGRLCRVPEGGQVVEVLRQHAPMWLMQLPTHITAEELNALRHNLQSTSRERMLREFAEALEYLTAKTPVVLVLEDLHWSDVSTLDLLAFIARRKEPARLLVIGSYRPMEMSTEGHPLASITRELYGHRLATELPLNALSEEAIRQYLSRRFGVGGQHETSLHNLPHTLHEQTGGNPLFLVSMVNDLIERHVLVRTDTGWEYKEQNDRVGLILPETIRHLVVRQSERLSAHAQHTLEAASVAGREFSAAAVAAALATDTATIEHQCEQLVQHQQFLRRLGVEEWPDGTLAARYTFLHAFYQQVWHERLSPTQLQQFHRRLGERKEQAYGDRAREIATELAIHFEQGRVYQKAVQYCEHAGKNALLRSAYQEAINHLTKGLDLLKTLPEGPERVQQELTLLHFLRSSLIVTKGLSSSEVETLCSRAWALCQQGGAAPQLIWILRGLCAYHVVRSQIPQACEVAKQVLRIAQGMADPINLVSTHASLGAALTYGGEFAEAHEHFIQATILSDQQWDISVTLAQGLDSRVSFLCQSTLALWMLGYPDQALKKSQEAVSLARRTTHYFSLAQALYFSALLYQLLREPAKVQQQAEQCIVLATEHRFTDWLGYASILKGWAWAELGHAAQGTGLVHQSLVAQQSAGVRLARSAFLGLLGEQQAKAGDFEAGLVLVEQALAFVENSGERYYEAELYRLKGELFLSAKRRLQNEEYKPKRKPRTSAAVPYSSLSIQRFKEAEACFLKAIDIAQKQQAKSWELRASTSLARLWQSLNRTNDAHKALTNAYEWFTEGFKTVDLTEARELLTSLA